jgi:hypothetical protein
MDRTTRTAIILLALGGFAAIGSLMLQSWMIKKLPPGKLQATAAAKAAASAVPQPAAPMPAAAAPVAPPPVATPSASQPVTYEARICRTKLSACLSANGKTIEGQESLGQCYALCVGVAGPCDKSSCGDLCEAVFGVRETCR